MNASQASNFRGGRTQAPGSGDNPAMLIYTMETQRKRKKATMLPSAFPFINSIEPSNVMRELNPNDLKVPFQLSTVTNVAMWAEIPL